jgi:hypothetical protein
MVTGHIDAHWWSGYHLDVNVYAMYFCYPILWKELCMVQQSPAPRTSPALLPSFPIYAEDY